MAITKGELREKLTDFLTSNDVDSAEELADSFVEVLDEEGAFEENADGE